MKSGGKTMIPSCFTKENESYITLPILRKFCKSHKLSTTDTRSELLAEIIQFGEKNDENKQIVKEWMESVLKEGIKHIYLRKVYSEDNTMELLKKDATSKVVLSKVFAGCPQKFIIDCKSDKQLKLQSYVKFTDGKDKIDRIEFYFTIILLEKNLEEIGERIIYPVYVDIDLLNGCIIGRGKSKANIYYCGEDEDIIHEENRTSVEKIVIKAIEYIRTTLSLSYEAKERSYANIKRNLYDMLMEFSFTPEEIENSINDCDEKLNNFISDVFKDLNINPYRNFDKAKHDLRIFLEKYISINHPDQAIFMDDREAYPIKLIATDSELTKVEATTSNKEPLQCKEKFFDNKKSLEYEKTCDGIVLCYNRIETKYFGTDPYVVKLILNKGFCVVKFESYVEEEDIQNVLSRVIKY